MNDGYGLGPPDIVFPALEKFAIDVHQKCLLSWNHAKTEVFSWSGVLPPRTTAGLRRAGEDVDGVFEPGFICYGVPIGTDKYVHHMMNKKVDEVAQGAKKCWEVLGEEKQSLWTVLRLSLSQQLDYWLQLSYPTHIKAAAEKMDQILWGVLEVAASSSIPRAEEGKSWECVVAVPGLHRRTFQDWVVRQPIKLGGLGLRSQADLSPAAFVGALEQTLPSFIGERGICPQLSHLVGDMSDVNRRWGPLLDSGCRTGVELARAWEIIQTEARGLVDFLGEELEGTLAVEVTGVGQGSVNGRTRKKVVEEREKLRGAVLVKALENYPDRQARPVIVWPQMKKLSGAWLLAIPG